MVKFPKFFIGLRCAFLVPPLISSISAARRANIFLSAPPDRNGLSAQSTGRGLYGKTRFGVYTEFGIDPPEIGNRAPVFYGSFVVGQDKLPFGKLAVRHGLQLVHRCDGNLAQSKVHVGHGGKDIFKRRFLAVLGVDRNNVFFLYPY